MPSAVNVMLNLSNILSKLPDKATRDDREKARENTIRLNRGLWLDETIFSRVRNSFRLSYWWK